MSNIVIVGAGHVGLTLAVDLETRTRETGLKPHLIQIGGHAHPFGLKSRAQPIQIEDILTGQRQSCRFPPTRIHRLTDPVSSILAKAKMIVVTAPDIPRLRYRIFDWLKHHPIEPNTTVVLVRGGQGGQIGVIDTWRNDPTIRRLNFVLVEDSFYGTRCIQGRIAFKRKRKTNISIFGNRPDGALALLRRLFVGPSIPTGAHDFFVVRPLDLQFDPLGYIIHLAVTLDDNNLELTKRDIQYLHYSAGVHEGNAERIELLDNERVRLATSYSARTRSFPDILVEQYGLMRQPTFLRMMKTTEAIYRSLSPPSLADLRSSRLIQEDVPALFTMNWLAQRCGEPLPATEAHSKRVWMALDRLGIDVHPLREYSERLDRIGHSRSDIMSQLACPA